MAIKSKNNKAVIFAGFLILISAAIMTGVASDLYYQIYYEYRASMDSSQKIQETEEDALENTWPSYDGGAEENLKSFAQFMYAGSYVMYWQLQEKLQQRTVLPSEVFFSDKIREQAKRMRIWKHSWLILMWNFRAGTMDFPHWSSSTRSSTGLWIRKAENQRQIRWKIWSSMRALWKMPHFS